jgi:hypothetical protein
MPDDRVFTDKNENSSQPHGMRLLLCGIAAFVVSLICLLLSIGISSLLLIAKSALNVEFLLWSVGVGTLSAIFGLILIRMARSGLPHPERHVIPEEADKYLVSAFEKSSNPIGDWTTLVSLSGFTGVFRKLELSGMPLATILMTFVFCFLSVVSVIKGFIDNVELSKAFLDMAKLTLGAFIGSFVTKGSTRDPDLGGRKTAQPAGGDETVRTATRDPDLGSGKTRPAPTPGPVSGLGN